MGPTRLLVILCATIARFVVVWPEWGDREAQMSSVAWVFREDRARRYIVPMLVKIIFSIGRRRWQLRLLPIGKMIFTSTSTVYGRALSPSNTNTIQRLALVA